ncbi:regulatory protein GemA [Thauera butanivorans]|uniref:regulatory protein GemA n=1 Tax=Thauera butanivorans TaxID=86174 RepID=UPI003AB610E6
MASASLASARAAQRAKLIKIVQTGRNRLRMDEDTYRDLLAAKSNGKRSAKDLSVDQLEAVIKHLRGCGFKPTKPANAAPRERRALDTSPTGSKARALWLWLHQVGIVRDPSEAALASFGKRISGVDALQWTRRTDKLIEGIKTWAARELPAKLEQRLHALQATGKLPVGMTVAGLVSGVSPTLDSSTFTALQRAWWYLDKVEQGNAAA